MNSIKQIKDILDQNKPEFIHNSDSSYIHAAVLMPIFLEKGVLKVLFTKRTDKVENHKGQISFPGGAVEEQDGSFEKTALRETYEEVGLLQKDVKILGRMDDTYTMASSFIVHPFVGFFPYPYPFRINRHEVKRLIEVPLNIFYHNDSNPQRNPHNFDGSVYDGPIYRYNGDTIWGATARMLENFVRITGGKLSLPEVI